MCSSLVRLRQYSLDACFGGQDLTAEELEILSAQLNECDAAEDMAVEGAAAEPTVGLTIRLYLPCSKPYDIGGGAS